MTIKDPRYRDQSVQGFHPGVISFYTPAGIQKLDTRFCNRIRAFKRGESFTEYHMSYWSVFSNKPKHEPRKEVEYVWTDTHASLTKDIEECPHLHQDIKDNLLFNLNQ